MASSMNNASTLDRAADPADAATPAARPAKVRIAEDKAMLRAAADLTRDLNVPKPAIYWSDLIASVVIGYGALAAAMLAPSVGWAIAAGIVAALALYRAESFIHELTHIKHAAVPGFRLGWNLLVGIPLLTPSFMYEGVHNLHHAKTRYGTVDDPEYLPLALMKWWTLPVFLLVAALAPIALLFRYAVLTPLSVIVPSLRKHVVERYSGLQINPSFRRPSPEGPPARSGIGWRLRRVSTRSPGRADCDGRHSAQPLPHFPGGDVGAGRDQSSTHAGGASVGE
jgi:hypothetical protein